MTDLASPSRRRGTALAFAALLVGIAAGTVLGPPLLDGLRPNREPPADREGPRAASLFTCGMHPQVIQDKPGTCPICGMKLTPLRREGDGATEGSAAGSGDRRVRYWWDPMMSPPYISDKPGKSPMGMDLVPVYEDEARAGPSVTIDPIVVQNMGVRVAIVEEEPLRTSLRALGVLEEVESRRHDIALKVGGFVDVLFADTEGMRIEPGDPLFEIYSPDILVAQEEVIAAKRAVGATPTGQPRSAPSGARELLDAARQKLVLWDVDPDQIDLVEASERASGRVIFHSRYRGYVMDKGIVQGSSVAPGERLLRIVDHDILWLNAPIYEHELPLLRIGQTARATFPSLPGESLEGKVIWYSPEVDPKTRATTARLVFKNPEHRLHPGMSAIVVIDAVIAARAIVVPRDAIIDTGIRQIAFVSLGNGRFEPRLVRVGAAAADGKVQVLEGLAPHETVVTSGQFLFDTESRTSAAIERMTGSHLLSPNAAGPGEHR